MLFGRARAIILGVCGKYHSNKLIVTRLMKVTRARAGETTNNDITDATTGNFDMGQSHGGSKGTFST